MNILILLLLFLPFLTNFGISLTQICMHRAVLILSPGREISRTLRGQHVGQLGVITVLDKVSAQQRTDVINGRLKVSEGAGVSVRKS